MRPPLRGKREAARRLAEEFRRRLEPVERVLPIRKAPAPASARPASPTAPEPPTPVEDPAAKIDAARERLRARIAPPDAQDADDEDHPAR